MARTRSDSERTYSIWPFLVGFVVLGTLGIAWLFLAGSPVTPTETIPSFTTTTSTTTTSTVPPVSASAAVTVPGGARAPDGVTAVTVDGDLTTYRFAVAGVGSAGPLHAVVARAQVVPTNDGASVIVGVACTEGDAESLAEIRVTETALSLNVEPIVVAPEFPGSCASGTVLRQVTVPLRSPIGGRQIVLSTPATAVPVPPS